MTLTLTKLGFLTVSFLGGDQFDLNVTRNKKNCGFCLNWVTSCFLHRLSLNMGISFYWYSPSFAKTWQWLWDSFYWSCGIFRILHPSFSKMVTTFSYKASACTSLGIPTVSRHSSLEYCAFNQHWRSILRNLLARRVWTCFTTNTSACNLEKDSFN